MRNSRPALAAATLTLTALLAACSSGDDQATVDKTNDTTTVTSTDSDKDSKQDAQSGEQQAAVSDYTGYVRGQVSSLQGVGGDFIAAVKAGDVEKSKELYPVARQPYERIEPVAESFGDLDARIDQREADLEQGDQWSGFHKIEKALWVDGQITDETKKDAEQLSKDIEELAKKVNAADYELNVDEIAHGAQELLDEVSTSKITGEENVFSHADLYDFEANLEGSKSAVNSLAPVISKTQPELLGEINSEFGKVMGMLGQYRQGDGFVSYEQVNEQQRKELSSALDALTAKVAEVQQAVAS
ncbi:iron uptake system protein EfeO [Corynebacterium gerontici]|uniref:Putative iron uptake system component EfeM n=1 Tax=Corynebacterium gerontici TaxID=2079234 RepID=A0A3G6IZ58_9CORY|nr:iron uptake system protein EfeO [Corynebacterium gerontici]AZA11075.1 putative iron uptake system component EfeM precursor [Corynebacterium gerontici]